MSAKKRSASAEVSTSKGGVDTATENLEEPTKRNLFLKISDTSKHRLKAMAKRDGLSLDRFCVEVLMAAIEEDVRFKCVKISKSPADS